MADPNWRTGGDDTFEESDAIKKLLKQIEELTARFQENSKMTNQQTSQLYKLIKSTESKLRIEDDHFKKRTLTIEQNRKAALDKITESGKQVRLNKLLANAMKQQLETYDSVKNSLLRPKGLKSSIVGVVDSLAHMTRTSKELEKAQKALADAKNVKGGSTKTEQQAVDALEDLKEKQTFGNKRLQLLVTRFGKLADSLEKHRGKLLLGAGMASILIGIITKALNVAPLFQAMMKLMTLTFTMILMPIGTFFGAVIRPMVMGLLKSVAPKFGEYMDAAMIMGDKVGQFIMDLSDPIEAGKNIIANAVGGDKDSQIGLMVGTGITGAAFLTLQQIVKKLLKNGGGVVDDVIKNTGKTPLETLTKVTVRQTAIATEVVKRTKGLFTTLTKVLPALPEKIAMKMTTTIGQLIVPTQKLVEKLGAKAAVKVGLKAIPIVGWATLIGDALGSVMKEFAPDQYEGVRQGAFGVGALFGDDKGEWTEKILDVLGFGETTTWEQIKEGFAVLDDALGGDTMTGIEKSLETTASMSQKFEDVVTIMAMDDGVAIGRDMTQIVKKFEEIKLSGVSATEAAEQTAILFQTANINIEKRLSAIIDANPLNDVNSPESRANRRAAAEQAAETQARLNKIGTVDPNPPSESWFDLENDPLMKPYYAPREPAINEIVTMADQKKKQEIAAIEKYNEVYGEGAYEKIYGSSDDPVDTRTEAEKQADRNAKTHGYGDLSGHPNHDAEGKTRDQMEAELDAQGNEAQSGYAAANGFSGMVTKPTMFLAGEAGSEHVQVTPHGKGGGGGNVININIAKIEKDVDFNQLKPMIQRWILEANSRRGMI